MNKAVMKFVIIHTAQGVPPAAVTACKEKLAENGTATVAVRSVLSPFDMVPTVQSARQQHGNDAIFLVLGVTKGTSGTESASAAFNLMSVSKSRRVGLEPRTLLRVFSRL